MFENTTFPMVPHTIEKLCDKTIEVLQRKIRDRVELRDKLIEKEGSDNTFVVAIFRDECRHDTAKNRFDLQRVMILKKAAILSEWREPVRLDFSTVELLLTHLQEADLIDCFPGKPSGLT